MTGRVTFISYYDRLTGGTVHIKTIRPALAAATGTAETNEDLAQCEASQSGPKGNAQQSEPREQEG